MDSVYQSLRYLVLFFPFSAAYPLKHADNVRILQLDDMAGQVAQAVSFRDLAKGQPLGAQRLGFQPAALVHLAVAVFAVPQYRVAQKREVGADLVGAAGDKPDAAERIGSGLADDPHFGDNLFISFCLPRAHLHFVALFRMAKPGDMPPGRRRTDRDGQVFLLQAVFPDDRIHIPQRGITFGRNDKPFGPAVKPVAERRRKPVFSPRVVAAFGCQLGGERINKVRIPGSVAVAQQVRRFVKHRDARIFIDDGDRRLARRLRLLRPCRGLGEPFVVQVQLDQIALGQAGIGRGALAVDLDALVSETFVQQAVRHTGGDSFDKAGQTHPLFIGAGGKLFHLFSSFYIAAARDVLDSITRFSI